MNNQEVRVEDPRSTSASNTQTDEQSLVALAKSGSSEAFGELYERYHSKLCRSAFRILHNQEDAEDAVQRAFQRAFTHLSGFREDSSFSTWVTRIAINEALMLLRRQKMFSAELQPQSDSADGTWDPETADERPTPEQTLTQNELRRFLIRAISHLRGTLRSVVVLRELQGLTSAETARRLGLTVSAVKARTFHAKRHLRRYLTQKYRLHPSDVLASI